MSDQISAHDRLLFMLRLAVLQTLDDKPPTMAKVQNVRRISSDVEAFQKECPDGVEVESLIHAIVNRIHDHSGVVRKMAAAAPA